MRKFLISVIVSLLLVAVATAPVMAETEQEALAAVNVGETISITLIDTGRAGIDFGSVTPPVTGSGDVDQANGTPAIKVTIGAETNVQVDIGIKGTMGSGSLAMSNWKYSTTFGGTKISITDSYVKTYGPVSASSSNDFYHWIDIPAGTEAGDYTMYFSYKAVRTDTGF